MAGEWGGAFDGCRCLCVRPAGSFVGADVCPVLLTSARRSSGHRFAINGSFILLVLASFADSNLIYCCCWPYFADISPAVLTSTAFC